LAADARLLERAYDPAAVFRLDGRVNVQTMIQFSEDEHIENVAIGDSQAWQVTPNRRANLLFVKPLSERAATNMTVVTDKRTYLFDLVASPASRTPLYMLSFSYPQQPEAEAPALAQESTSERAAAAERPAASDPYGVVDPAKLNHAWNAKGDRKLRPVQVYDNGEATFLTWPAGTSLPAILIKDQKGSEGPVNYAVRGDVIVVEGVPSEIVLRSGEDVASLFNQGPARQPRPQQALAQAANTTEVK
jgi:type IV secretion system protein VirB9